MYKDGQSFCLDLIISLLHKIGSCLTLHFLCCYVNYLSRMKTNHSVYNAHLDFRGMQAFVWFYRKNVVVTPCWCNFHQQKTVLTQF